MVGFGGDSCPEQPYGARTHSILQGKSVERQKFESVIGVSGVFDCLTDC